MMSKAFFLFSLFTLLIAGCGGHGDLVKKYNDFGIKCARMGLWDEAISRWERALEIDPGNAKIHNNLGIAYESMGKFEAARKEYETAIEFDPGSRTYKKNYDRFKRNTERIDKENETQKSELKPQNSGFYVEKAAP